jgi:hypothetical protein
MERRLQERQAILKNSYREIVEAHGGWMETISHRGFGLLLGEHDKTDGKRSSPEISEDEDRRKFLETCRRPTIVTRAVIS